MLSIFKSFFGKPVSNAAPAFPAATAAPSTSTQIPTIEVAHLSLAAITARFPDDLRSLIIREPEATATVALPIPTILKQLPMGTVKMSLASLHRQAQGLIKALPPGDKRSVEVPLSEIFRHVRLNALKRRADQRPLQVPENGFNLFGDSSHPYRVAPDEVTEPAVEAEPAVLDLTPEVTEQWTGEIPLVLKMDAPVPAAESPLPNGTNARVAPPASMPRVLAPPPDLTLVRHSEPVSIPHLAATPPAAARIATNASPALSLPLSSLDADWSEDIRAEITQFDATTEVALPMADIAEGLVKGRVAFSWKQIRSWLKPQPQNASPLENTTVALPLKVVAPAFFASSKKSNAARRHFAVDESIPALFNGGPTPTPTATPTEGKALSEAPGPEQAPEPQKGKLPESISEIFGQPQKREWTPAEIVAGTVKLPGVAGAVVALQEGLQVAASLPEGVKSEVVAAFLPQIFARLNQYSGEMRLGEVDDILFTTHGAHCQIYRLGYIYFAILGKAGEALPWHELRIITEELAQQTQK